MREKKRFLVLAGILFTISLLYVALTIAGNYTKTRLIQRKEDEVKAYYTALYFEGTGEGSAIALDNNIGYVTFNLMNYIDEDVTERDIVYEIATRDNFYTDTGAMIPNTPEAEGNTTLYPSIHVLDVWGQPKEVGRDTWKYSFNVFSNTGEKYTGEPISGSNADAVDYLFKYEKLDNGTGSHAVGKTHNVTLQIQRNISEKVEGTENITVVVQLLKPYKEVYLINMTISERLIIFSNTEVVEFEHHIEELHIQTADIFAYENSVAGGSTVHYFPKPMRVTLTWDNLVLNEILLNNFPEGVVVTDLTTLSSDSGSITLLIPQCSDLKLQFFATDVLYHVTAKVEIYNIDIPITDVTLPSYVLYDSKIGGYTSAEIGKNNSDNTALTVPKDCILVLNESKTGLIH